MFTEALAKTGQELVFFIHGYSVQTKSMVTSTDEMQKNFNANQPDVDQALVVPVDWACAERPWWHFRPLATYYEDQECSEKAGRAIGKFLRSLKSTNSQKLNVVAHSMGNRVLRSVGKSAGGQARWDMEALAQGKSLLEAAPKDLQSNENLFENIFFVSADIPESVFEEPTDGTESQQEEHALKSGVAALAVMSKRMHVLHANGWDQALNASSALNGGNARLGSRGPYASGESTKVCGRPFPPRSRRRAATCPTKRMTSSSAMSMCKTAASGIPTTTALATATSPTPSRSPTTSSTCKLSQTTSCPAVRAGGSLKVAP